MPSSPLVEETNAFSYAISSGGTPIPGSYEVMSMSITQQVGVIGSAEITFRDGSAESQSFEISDSDVFKPGAEIEIKLGYKSDNDPIFKGVVTKQSIRVDSGSVSSLQITLKDKAAELTKGKKSTIYSKMTDSAIMEKIINDAGFTPKVTATSFENPQLPRVNSTDWDFINTRAGLYGMQVSTNVDEVIIAKPNPTDEPELQVQFGYDMIDFDTEVDGSDQYEGVECSAWSSDDQDMIKGTAEDPTLSSMGNIPESDLEEVLSAGKMELTTSAGLTEDELKIWASGIYERLSLSRFKGNVTFNGTAKAKVNSTIKLLGLSDRFNGNSFITGITHSIDGGKWITKANIGIEPTSFAEKNASSSPSSSGIIPSVAGLQIGVVTKVDSDPDKKFRIQVSVPAWGKDSDPVWARISTFYAGNGIGAFFMPEVNDEVILAFVNDDPTDIVIMGCLYSSKSFPPPVPQIDEKNTIKTLVTQSKLQLKFDDDKKIITVLTPGENTMVISDEDKNITVQTSGGNKMVLSDNDKGITLTDQNGNQIQMNDSGIVVESKSDLTLKAAQGVKIQGATIEATGDQSVKATGGTLNLTGNQTTSITGNTECTMTSSGQTNVKGTMVNIN
ncbi:MAG: hypothetical protein CL840_05005 [Crocinitomicaceae bacterium]|nr:hypothetical protein [Crocinitomicaceae bacterium]|tara:strand:+ start:54 stop:1901 length:1848 start_codon:yes stop_codon:yes gene_type:complete